MLTRSAPDELEDVDGMQPGRNNPAAAEATHQELPNGRRVVNPRGWREGPLLVEVKVVFPQQSLIGRERRLVDTLLVWVKLFRRVITQV